MTKKEKYKYCFPNFMAKAMAKVDFRAQMEAGMLSQFLLICGLTAMMLFLMFTQQTSGFYKFMIIFNLACGWLLISSYLVTTYQQYTSYMDALGIDPEEEKRRVKLRGNIFKRIWLAIKGNKKINLKEDNTLEIIKEDII